METIIFLDIDGVKYYPEGKPQPKPLLADAKVGDICQRRDGKWTSMAKITDATPNIVKTIHCTDGRIRNESGQHNPLYVTDYDIVHTEPLAPESSAEWAWQTLMLCKIVSHPAEGIFHDTYYTKEGFIRCMAKTGWKLYEPEPPFAKVKVGDWVEITYDNGYKYHCPVIQSGCSIVVMFDGAETYFDINGNELCKGENEPSFTISRILKPEDVRVKISLEGTVEKRKDNRFAFNLVSGITNSAIHYDMLDPATAAIVKELVAKQGEK